MIRIPFVCVVLVIVVGAALVLLYCVHKAHRQFEINHNIVNCQSVFGERITPVHSVLCAVPLHFTDQPVGLFVR